MNKRQRETIDFINNICIKCEEKATEMMSSEDESKLGDSVDAFVFSSTIMNISIHGRLLIEKITKLNLKE